MVRFRVLGPLRVGAETAGHTLRSANGRVVLAGLLLHANQVVSTDRIIDWLWGEQPQPRARQNLQVIIGRLRKRVGELTGVEDVIGTRNGGYVCELDPDDVDALLFRKLLTEARATRDPEAESQVLRKALGLWRGPVLEDVPSTELHSGHGIELDELRLQCLERAVELDLRLGRHEAAVGELSTVVVQEPLRERFWEQLLLALHRSGRQSEALRRYQQACTVFRDELDVPPWPALDELRDRILRNDASLALEQPGFGCHLPSALADFVGHAGDVETIVTTLSTPADEVRTVVVSGQGGVGKSTVAIRAAHRLRTAFPDGQLLVHLSHPDTYQALGTLLRQCAVADQAMPTDVDGRAAMLRTLLTDRRVLVVLDGVLDHEQASALMPGTPGCGVIITSRSVLPALPTAARVSLRSLSPAESGTLLAGLVGFDRAAAEPDALAGIVAACGGLPLALRIAGARIATTPDSTLATMAERLAVRENRLDELDVDGTEVRAAIAFSHHALSDVDREAFAWLGFLPGDDLTEWMFTALSGRKDAARVLERLVRASLVTPAGADPTGDQRYQVHDLIRLYAEEQLDAERRADGVHRLLDAFLHLAAEEQRRTRRTSGYLPIDVSEVRAVVPTRTTERLLAVPLLWQITHRRLACWLVEQACALGRYADAARLWELVGTQLDPNVIAVVDVLRAAAEAAGDERQVWRVEFGRALYLADVELTRSRELLLAAEAAFTRLGCAEELRYVHGQLTFVHLLLGDPQRAAGYAARAADGARAAGDHELEIEAMAEYGRALVELGREREALEVLDGTLDKARALPDRSRLQLQLNRMATVCLRLGRFERAWDLATEWRELQSARTDPVSSGWARIAQARAATGLGRTPVAMEALAEAAELFADRGNRRAMAAVASALGAAYHQAGDPATAVELLARAASELDAIGSHPAAERARKALADAEAELAQT